ncbi:DUF481 domain-containing protein [Sphingomonas nostoxanthinifaciens]|uniref:DUF481 domain-containing protein n=1 Tax=Sphingomonas nostoxanthinifaciens TaxID=2872652 RepID=UPI001CC1DC21|nr:DUF481 domain-containing protein [Sphingomonas nostoxanthinifaciens]UAK26210.1 DUF481 domain-containing protein [Sphingomonas nostoxanthinifaciens]
MAQVDLSSPFVGVAPVPALAPPAAPKPKPKGIQADPTVPPVPANPDAADALAAMIAAAYRSGDDATINAVVGVAKATFPDRAAEIDRLAAGDAAILASARKEENERQQARIASARFFEIWKGELEFGASRSTGSTQQLGIYASAKLNREGLNWIQKFSGRLDYQQTDHVTTTERVVALYQPDYKINDKLYVYGLGQYEHDRFLGYNHRFTGGTGVGYTVFNRGDLKLQVEGGPAVRQTDYTDLANRTTLAGRAAMSARVAITPTLVFSQDAALFFEARDTTASATTSLDTKLIGALKARLSYNVQFEQNAPQGGHELDTISRATLVYSF